MLLLLTLLLSIGRGCDRSDSPSVAETQPAAVVDPTAKDRLIRVLLIDGAPDCELTLNESYDLIDADTGETLRAALPAGQISVVFDQGSRSVRFPQMDWQFQVRAVDVMPRGAMPIEVRLPREWKRYRGAVRLVQREGTGGAVLNVVDLEEYLIAVVASELPASFHVEAFKAQAIASRTYAWYTRQTLGAKRDWDVWATEKSQAYHGYDRESAAPLAAQAVRQTRGLVCTWASPQGRRIFCTYYCSRCGGTTTPAKPARGEVLPDPLKGGVVCPLCSKQDAYHWPTEPTVRKSDIASRLLARYPNFVALEGVAKVEPSEVSSDGRVLKMRISDAAGHAMELEGDNFRLAVDPTGRSVQSTYFTLIDSGDSVTFADGRGFGHGIGMCQYGADTMARGGLNAVNILQHYYPGSMIERAY